MVGFGILRELECEEHVLEKGIKLRKLKESDKEDMYEYMSHKENFLYLNRDVHTQIQQTCEFIYKRLKNQELLEDLLWGIELIEENKLIGVVRLYHIDFHNKQAEISYIINQRYSEKGYATIAVQYALKLCFEKLEIDRVIAFYIDENKKSINLLKRCGAVEDMEWNEVVEIKNKIYKMHRCFIVNKNVLEIRSLIN